MDKFDKLTPSDLEIFDEKQREVVVKLQDSMAKAARDAVDTAVGKVREEFG